MNCNRCGNMMTYEKFYGSHGYFWGWRCIFCGEILDEVILENRREFGKRQRMGVLKQEAAEGDGDKDRFD